MMGLAGVLGAAALVGCSAGGSGAAAVAPREVFATCDEAMLRDLKLDASRDATLSARAGDDRRQLVSVPEHGCAFIIQPMGKVVLKNGTAECLDAASGDAAWTVILQSVYGDWRIIGNGYGWMPQLAGSVTAGWPDLVTGTTLGEGVASINLLQYDGRHYRADATVTITSDLCDWARWRCAIPGDLAAAILADMTGRQAAKVQDIGGMAFIRPGDPNAPGSPDVALVSMSGVVADGWSVDFTHRGDRSANVFLYARRDGRWARLGSVLTQRLVCSPDYDVDTCTWTLTAQTGGSLSDPTLEVRHFHQGALPGAGVSASASDSGGKTMP
jgi:hypothetical protein